ncbi:MAG: hypothetical protein OCD01_16125, partial [Fibrobacterales bacterium]
MVHFFRNMVILLLTLFLSTSFSEDSELEVGVSIYPIPIVFNSYYGNINCKINKKYKVNLVVLSNQIHHQLEDNSDDRTESSTKELGYSIAGGMYVSERVPFYIGAAYASSTLPAHAVNSDFEGVGRIDYSSLGLITGFDVTIGRFFANIGVGFFSIINKTGDFEESTSLDLNLDPDNDRTEEFKEALDNSFEIIDFVIASTYPFVGLDLD